MYFIFFCPSSSPSSSSSYHLNATQEGDGIPDLHTTAHVVEVLKQVGFEVIDARDLVDEGEVPWYQPLVGGWSLENIRSSRLGRIFTTVMVNVLETLRLAPKGTTKTHDFLIKVWVWMGVGVWVCGCMCECVCMLGLEGRRKRRIWSFTYR